MKKIIELGNNIKVEVEKDRYKIISANGSVINLDGEGEILSYGNVVTEKKLKRKEAYLKRFIKIGEGERGLIYNWCTFNSNVDKEKECFFNELREAIDVIKYDFYVVVIFSSSDKVELLSEYKQIIPDFEARVINKSEIVMLIAYYVATQKWDFEEAFNKDNSYVLGNMYILKKE